MAVENGYRNTGTGKQTKASLRPPPSEAAVLKKYVLVPCSYWLHHNLEVPQKLSSGDSVTMTIQHGDEQILNPDFD
jgi:hypothetical protein